MFFNSIRWRLQLWYGLLLVVVLAGFGVTSYQLERNRQWRRVDDELQRRVSALASANRQPPRNRFPGERPPGAPEPDDQRRPPGERPFDRPENFPPQRPRDFHLSPQHAVLFDESDPNGFYFFVRGRGGEELAHSPNAPLNLNSLVNEIHQANDDSNPSLRPPAEPQMQPPRMRGLLREVLLVTPPGEIILVGRSVAREINDLHRTALKLTGVGAIILALGLAGGWWLASRMIRPIESISATALKISAGNLSQRIDSSDTDSELGQLAGVLNSTFARLDAAFTQQARFTADAAHELRTPIAVMLTQTQTALARARDAADYRETIEACQRATQRMRRLVESLLALARLDAGQEKLPRTHFDFSKAIRDCIDLVNPLARERGIKIESDLAEIEYDGDAEQVAQVITNLLTNAIHYNKENGIVRVKLEQTADATIFTVKDTGHGISAEDLPHIFERFYRAEKSRSSGRTGLGLSISKAIAEKHCGSIEASNNPEEGANFVMRLPR